MQPVFLPKSRIGRYELVAKLATGGMGEIFLARLEGAAGFEKLFVVKRILPHLADDVRFRAMLIDEARIASRLSHPNICQVYELGETDGELYIVMEYLEGVTLLPLLRQASRKSPLDLGMVACIVQQITEGLHYAHELRDRDGANLNIIHRDVTPSNIFLTDNGAAKVLDFGIAKAKDASNDTQAGTIKGKHAYMAPEQLKGMVIDRRVDIFAVGILVFETLALRRLFQRRTDYLTLQAVMEDPIPDVRAFRRDLPAPLVSALAMALQRDRGQRFETIRQFGAAVTDAIAAEHRIWTASQLADELATRFSAELQRHRAAVQAAVSSVAVSAELPSLEEYAVGTSYAEEEDDGDLPIIDAEDVTSFSDGAPTRVEWMGAAPKLEAPERAPAPSAASSSRSRLERARVPWGKLLLAGAFLATATATLTLLWRPSPQTVLVVTQEPHRAGVAEPDASRAADPGSAVDAGAAETAPRDGEKRTPLERLQSQVNALRPQLRECLRRHPTAGTLVLRVETDGRVSSVSLAPKELEDTPLSPCVRELFAARRFARQPVWQELKLPFSGRAVTPPP
ncbi:MAG: protein kinase [Kofleriaceae bacterium]